MQDICRYLIRIIFLGRSESFEFNKDPSKAGPRSSGIPSLMSERPRLPIAGPRDPVGPPAGNQHPGWKPRIPPPRGPSRTLSRGKETILNLFFLSAYCNRITCR